MKKRIITATYLLLLCLFCYAQNQLITEKTERINDTLYVVENGELFQVNPKIVIVKPIIPLEEIGFDIKAVYTHRLGYIDIEVPEGIDVLDYTAKLRKTGKFESVELFTETKLLSVEATASESQGDFLTTIKATTAWVLTTGNPNIKVAVLDSGINRDHLDIGTGYDGYSNVSYTQGYDYIMNMQYAFPASGHGTHVAGVLGAKANNSIGIAGVAGGNHSSGVTMLSYRLTNIGNGFEHVDDAIYDAVTAGAKIINMSISTSYSSVINQAISHANACGVTIVCASGNNNSSSLSYPASHSLTIAVGAIMDNDYRWIDGSYGSNYGNGLDLVAPGWFIYTTDLTNSYCTVHGTSVAAPQVTGTIALMLSVNPTLTPYKIRTILDNTAQKIPYYASSGWNQEVGYGLLNTFAAVKEAIGEIKGASYIVNSEQYYIEGLPSDFIVYWSLSDSYYDDYCIQQNTPSTNRCTITRASGHNMQNATLTASIMKAGAVVCTRTMTVNAYDGFMGSYFNGVTTKNINLPYPLLVLPNTLVKITSPYLVGATASYAGDASITQWSFDNSSGVIYVGMPSSGSCVVSVSCTDGNSYNLPIVLSSSPSMFSTGITDGQLEVSLIPDEQRQNTNVNSIFNEMTWTLEIFNAISTEKVLTKTIRGGSYIIDTTGWKSGVYVVKVTIGKEVYSEKVVIK